MPVMFTFQYLDEWVVEGLIGYFEINYVLFDVGFCLVAVPLEFDTMKPNRYVHIQIQTYDYVYTSSIQHSIPTPLPETPQPTARTQCPSRTHR